MAHQTLFRQRAYLYLSRFTRGMTLGARAAVLRGDGHVLLVRHTYVPGWYLPGGAVDPGETFAEAVERELVEEGCLRLTAPPVLFGVYLNRRLSARDHVAVYVCREWQHDPGLVRSAEIAESGFFPPDLLPADATDATRRRLAEILHGGTVSGDW